MKGSYLGPFYTEREIVETLDNLKANCIKYNDFQEVANKIAEEGSFIKSRTNPRGPFILATHGHVIECMLLTLQSALYILNVKIDGHLGIKGIHGVVNGSVSALINSNFVFFNFVS